MIISEMGKKKAGIFVIPAFGVIAVAPPYALQVEAEAELVGLGAATVLEQRHGRVLAVDVGGGGYVQDGHAVDGDGTLANLLRRDVVVVVAYLILMVDGGMEVPVKYKKKTRFSFQQAPCYWAAGRPRLCRACGRPWRAACSNQ